MFHYVNVEKIRLGIVLELMEPEVEGRRINCWGESERIVKKIVYLQFYKKNPEIIAQRNIVELSTGTLGIFVTTIGYTSSSLWVQKCKYDILLTNIDNLIKKFMSVLRKRKFGVRQNRGGKGCHPIFVQN
ncbi:hypothetical protein RhiirA1_400361 [Rhizophagus irregularis]|uniref:Uncharacterized protein n=1 Tax=Rhizophagus irregularis TaxID=588596 RepID=A0A2I1EQA2_9GLOM|nr:hypothetical protein RhiirA1_400361 [Rhizophagus irregularis]PKY24302.1 hypothetical protein RhiirB3_387880 [Rhizophagus irregularis]